MLIFSWTFHVYGIEVYSFMSPNNDFDNDVLVIRNIERFPDNSIEIFNRYGQLVFETTGYGQQEDKFFRGVSEGKGTISASEELPAGTYFYVLSYKLDNGQIKQRKGYLYLTRK